MRWLIEIGDIVGDQRFLRDLLEKIDISIHIEIDKIYLVNNQWDLLESVQVCQKYQQIQDLIVSESKSLSFTMNSLHVIQESGLLRAFHFAHGNVTLGNTSCYGEGTIIRKDNNLSDEETLRLKLEQEVQAKKLENEYQDKLSKVAFRIKLITQDECASKIHQFLQQRELNAYTMYNIMQLIESDIGGREQLKRQLSSKEEVNRFYESVNHPDVFGNEARHITNKEKPPSNIPMYPEEAKGFVNRVVDLWFEQKQASQGKLLHNSDIKD